jgi:hypothetical protein
LRAACGEIIAFTDDDCIPSPGWLNTGTRALTVDLVAVAGRIIVTLPPTPTDYEYNASHLAHSEFVTVNCFFRRDALISIGGFDERFTSAWREDSDLIFTLQEHGARYYSAPDAVVIHPVRPAPWGISSTSSARVCLMHCFIRRTPPCIARKSRQHLPYPLSYCRDDSDFGCYTTRSHFLATTWCC